MSDPVVGAVVLAGVGLLDGLAAGFRAALAFRGAAAARAAFAGTRGAVA
jgi:hypothetical protein